MSLINWSICLEIDLGIQLRNIKFHVVLCLWFYLIQFHLLQVKVFMQENYLSNWIQVWIFLCIPFICFSHLVLICIDGLELVCLQALFNSLPPEDYKNAVLVLGGDGRYFNHEAAQVIFRAATHLTVYCSAWIWFKFFYHIKPEISCWHNKQD